MGATAALAAFSVASTAITSISQAKAQKAAGAYQQQTYEQNARLAEIQAQDAIDRGETDAKNNDKKTKVLIGAQRARLAAQGIDIESGSALDVQTDTAAAGAEDSLTIRNNAWRESWGYKVQALNYRTGGNFAMLTANNAANQTILTGGMQAVNSIASAWGKRTPTVKNKDPRVGPQSGVRSDGTKITVTSPYDNW